MNLKYGIVTEVKKGFAKVAFNDEDIVTDFLPMLVRKSMKDKDSWPLDVNEQVVCIMDEYCESGVIIGAIYSDEDAPDGGEGPGKFRKKFEDGTVIEYDKGSKVLTANVKGKVDLIADDDIKVTGSKNVEITATVKAKVTAPNIEADASVKAKITAPAIEMIGAVTVTGAMTVTGALVAASIATSGGGAITAAGATISAPGGLIEADNVKAGAISLLTHKHTGVTTGGGSSGTPIP